MQPKETAPLKPFVTVEQMEAFDPNRPETYTESRIINAVCKAFCHLGWRATGKAVAAYLELDLTQLSAAVQIITGYKFSYLRAAVIHCRAQRLCAQHPSWDPNRLARAVGYRDRASLYHALGRETYDDLIAKYTK